ncbi:hypothetical protein TBLA_0H00320 [Henningerozyma blattae CBS 6284]|uniref:DNA repair protein RAD5 n=1 Tax=Henningerozyma blattae (strain ATCC 34711 / CBS 6284 / DSM 70876 / NBRC 10599 / NRRL Y-10934 / UCD 77-7) TaxID=1071380 RepID=I2H7H3_HENB6|nr:hypothetical protein TBLA_0H00320 [Tetrapisispora blattae CBS 6284]CCH62325.1 hypothetical protein TBLA_0H00320 [Tetrapisispora blattae CBS 6284]
MTESSQPEISQDQIKGLLQKTSELPLEGEKKLIVKQLKESTQMSADELPVNSSTEIIQDLSQHSNEEFNNEPVDRKIEDPIQEQLQSSQEESKNTTQDHSQRFLTGEPIDRNTILTKLKGLHNDCSFLFAANKLGLKLSEDEAKEENIDEYLNAKRNDFFKTIKSVIPSIDNKALEYLYVKHGNKEDSIEQAILDFSNTSSDSIAQGKDDSFPLVETSSMKAHLITDNGFKSTLLVDTNKKNFPIDTSSPKHSNPATRSSSFQSPSQLSFNKPPLRPNSQNNLPLSNSPASSQRKRTKEYLNRDYKRLKPDLQWKRFIGALQVNALATRPTSKPVEYGSQLSLVKSIPSKNKRIFDSSGKRKNAMSSFIRIMDTKANRELGRVPEDIARIVFPLLGDSIVDFEATMVFCNNRRISIGDTFVFQLDCFLTSKSFEDDEESTLSQGMKGLGEKNSTFNKGMTETDSELHSRTQRMALLNLFDIISLQPILDESKALQENATQKMPDFIDLEDENYNKIDITDDSTSIPSTQHQEDAMDLNQIQSFYKAAQSLESIQNLPETTPSKDIFSLDLRRYQKQGLSWMLRREREFSKVQTNNDKTDPVSEGSITNPLWKQFKWPKDMSWATQKLSEISTDLDDIFFYANLHTGKFSLDKPVIKSMVRGGILSDEMGLGKTISTLALILSVPEDTSIVDKKLFETSNDLVIDLSKPEDAKRPYASKTTLIVVPMSLLNQWSEEFVKANASSEVTHELYYGGNVSSLKKLLINNNKPPSVIITTYGVVQSEWTKIFKETSPHYQVEVSTGLYSLDFFRIVIDEGHTIRNRTTATSKAIMGLSSKRKWILTGTPIINRLDDLYSLVKFLNLEPWSQVNYWKTFISNPFENKQFKQALDVVNSILDPVLLRRTKQMKDIDGKHLVELPPKEVIVEKLEFTNKQNKVYKQFLDKAELSVKSGLARGDLLKQYSTILVHILRLRQICCDESLLGTQDENDEDLKNSNKLVNNKSEIESILKKTEDKQPNNSFTESELQLVTQSLTERFLKNNSYKNMECPICTTDPIDFTDSLFTECGHAFCKSCLEDYLKFQSEKGRDHNCPTCRKEIDSDRLITLQCNSEITEKPNFIHYDNNHKPAKLNALLKHLHVLKDCSPGEQVVVFSQFSSYLDILENEIGNSFKDEDVEIFKFDGRLSLKDRHIVLQNFGKKNLNKMKVLLLSLKAGGVGLNLTVASHAYMMDPWWSPSLEDQAIDRIHRIGQTTNVKVVRFIIKDSIEEKILRIQERKRRIGEAMDADEDERRKRRIEEIQMLFE